ncbi:unnamed protein product [Arabidopsis arenosa]|uniref:Uncharacterized protein n=1 Tax=Arabidopsis arenosa TaxID=38785 RepID=A0A8S2AX89_ARAAE|nr:unnamed protein product [Arabidopsis arenosa]
MSLRKNYLPGFLPWDYESVPLSRHTDVAEFISSSKITSRVKKALKRLGIFPHFVRKIGEPREQQISDIEIRRRIKAWYEGHLANNTRGVLGLMAADGGYISQLLEIQNEGGFEIVIINRPGVATHSFYTVLSQFPVITDSVAMVQRYQNSAGLGSGSGSRLVVIVFGGNGGRDQGGYGWGGSDQGGYGWGGRDQGGYGWGGRDQGGYGWGGRDQGGYGWGGRDQGGYGWGGRDRGGYGWGGRDRVDLVNTRRQSTVALSPSRVNPPFSRFHMLAWTTVPVPSHPPVAPTAMENLVAVTSVYWDMETCPVPLGCAPRRISPIGAVEDVPYDILREVYPSGISVPYG